jgi:hydroxymethylglutaryl-CoA synthase
MNDKIGIVGYGVYVPRWRIKVEEIARIWGQDPNSIRKGLLVEEKSVADIDEDTVTISIEAAKNALLSAKIDAQKIGALFVGSESHPYAVKPSGTIVADVLGMGPDLMLADYEFACKAGTAAIQTCYAMVKSQMIEYGMAIGADTAQGQPGDALEYTAASGGASFIVGHDPLAIIEATYSYTSDTPDFWRREGQEYPRHGARFTGKPAYFHHTLSATQGLLKKTNQTVDDFDYVVLHMPNGKFPREACKALGIDEKKLLPSLVVEKIGNTYSGSSLLGLCAVLDKAKPGDRILMTSFGSGAGSDSFALTVTDAIKNRRVPHNFDYYANKKDYIDYGHYVRMRKKLKV